MTRVRASERGVSLVESLVAVAILGTALVMFMSGLSTGLLSTGRIDRLSTAHELARSQLEDTKAQAFVIAPYTYPSVAAPAGYTVTSEATDAGNGDSAVQLITVVVTKDTEVLFTLEGLKVDR
jgi:prepilin-type N-terminal cleavage/methylation domain-containing protein